MNFFVYIDCKPDGTPFYVGKGNANRVKHRSRKNRIHKNICAKHSGWRRETVFEGSEADCFQLEIALILFYGRADLRTGTLVNLTSGGDGVAGIVKSLSPEHRSRISEAHKGKYVSDATRAAMSIAQTGKKRSDQARQKLRDFFASPEGRLIKSEAGRKANENRRAKKLALLGGCDAQFLAC